MSRTTNRSPFAKALEGLLDETLLFSRREWASLLRIKEAAISQWLSEDTIPRAINLNMVYGAVELASDAKKGPLEAFRQVAELPALVASPKNGKRMLPTVWAYMKRPLFDELSKKLATLSPAEQEKLLVERFPPEEATRTAANSPMLPAQPAHVARTARDRLLVMLSASVTRCLCQVTCDDAEDEAVKSIKACRDVLAQYLAFLYGLRDHNQLNDVTYRVLRELLTVAPVAPVGADTGRDLAALLQMVPDPDEQTFRLLAGIEPAGRLQGLLDTSCEKSWHLLAKDRPLEGPSKLQSADADAPPQERERLEKWDESVWANSLGNAWSDAKRRVEEWSSSSLARTSFDELLGELHAHRGEVVPVEAATYSWIIADPKNRNVA